MRPPPLDPLPPPATGSRGRMAGLSGLAFGLGLAGLLALLDFGAGAVALGAVGGGLFGQRLVRFLDGLGREVEPVRRRHAAAGAVLDGPANHGAAGGWLYLLPDRLRFEPHGGNLGHVPEVEIPTAEIVRVERVRHLGLNPNGLRVTLRSGQQVRFVGWQAKRWLEAFRRLGIDAVG